MGAWEASRRAGGRREGCKGRLAARARACCRRSRGASGAAPAWSSRGQPGLRRAAAPVLTAGSPPALRHPYRLCTACVPQDKLFKSYIEMELQLGNIDRCRTLYQKYIEWAPANAGAWGRCGACAAGAGAGAGPGWAEVPLPGQGW